MTDRLSLDTSEEVLYPNIGSNDPEKDVEHNIDKELTNTLQRVYLLCYKCNIYKPEECFKKNRNNWKTGRNATCSYCTQQSKKVIATLAAISGCSPLKINQLTHAITKYMKGRTCDIPPVDPPGDSKVYFLLDTYANFVKIGVSVRVHTRVTEIMQNRPGFALLGTLPGTQLTEQWIHTLFSPDRIAGEGFNYQKIQRIIALIANGAGSMIN